MRTFIMAMHPQLPRPEPQLRGRQHMGCGECKWEVGMASTCGMRRFRCVHAAEGLIPRPPPTHTHADPCETSC